MKDINTVEFGAIHLGIGLFVDNVSKSGKVLAECDNGLAVRLFNAANIETFEKGGVSEKDNRIKIDKAGKKKVEGLDLDIFAVQVNRRLNQVAHFIGKMCKDGKEIGRAHV